MRSTREVLLPLPTLGQPDRQGLSRVIAGAGGSLGPAEGQQGCEGALWSTGDRKPGPWVVSPDTMLQNQMFS